MKAQGSHILVNAAAGRRSSKGGDFFKSNVTKLTEALSTPLIMNLRQILHTTVYVVIALTILMSSGASKAGDFKLGVQSYMLSRLSFDQMVEFASKHEIKYLVPERKLE